MKTIEIDIESRSDVDLTKAGVYRYVDSPYFAITLMSVSLDDGEVQLYDLACGDTVPENILRALVDESVIKRAFNVNFERVCLSKYLREQYPQIFRSYSIDADTVGDYLSPVGWQCTMIHCRTLGLPSTLADAGAALKLEQQKMPEGKALIKYFCIPYDTVNDVPQFHTPADAPDKWETFKAYNRQDVEAELAIDRRLSRFPVPDAIWEEFYLDQEINDRGMKYTPISIPNNEAQFLETRKFQIEEIARLYRVPLHMIGDLEHATFSNIEQQSLEFVKYTLDPWLVRWEQGMQKALLTDSEKGRYFIKFNVEGLLRGDYASRMQGYATARQNGWMSANDIRELEDMNAIPDDEGGNLYLVNGSFTKLADAGAFYEGKEEHSDE